MRPPSLPPASVLGQRHPHGTRIRYMGGCKCVPCKAAASRYETDRLAKRKAGLSNGITTAAPARRRILYLSRRGVGRRAVCAAARISRTVYSKIRSSRRANCREETVRRILAVSLDSAFAGAYVDARPTWRRVVALREAGWSKAAIAFATGHVVGALQIGRDRVTKRNADRIRRLHDLFRDGEVDVPRTNRARVEVACEVLRVSARKILRGRVS